ncbi:MAG: LytTR family DNA-binding domain-containing protein [Bacteroidota bacterium]|nr:LytTR family DNA-binding domain-containing protein [Bacteroidota bacterium]
MVCVIIDDDSSCISSLELMIKKYYPNIKSIYSAQTIDLGYELIIKHKPDVVFLDIEMNGETGFDLFLKIPKPSFATIFATSHDKYMQSAIKNACFDYLLKPIDTKELVETLTRLEVQINEKSITSKFSELLNNISLNSSQDSKIAIPTAKGYVFLTVDEIICCFADGKYTTVYGQTFEKITSTKNIGEFETFLSRSIFFRCHRSWIINIKRIKSFSKGDNVIVLSNGVKADLSSRNRDEFMKLFSVF